MLTATLEQMRVPGRVGRALTRPDRLLADKGNASRANRAWLRERGIPATIPEREDQITHRRKRRGRPIDFGALQRQRYRGRNVAERCFNMLKQWRGIAMGSDRLARNYPAVLCLAARGDHGRIMPHGPIRQTLSEPESRPPPRLRQYPHHLRGPRRRDALRDQLRERLPPRVVRMTPRLPTTSQLNTSLISGAASFTGIRPVIPVPNQAAHIQDWLVSIDSTIARPPGRRATLPRGHSQASVVRAC